MGPGVHQASYTLPGDIRATLVRTIAYMGGLAILALMAVSFFQESRGSFVITPAPIPTHETALLDRMGVVHGVDLNAIMDVAEDLVVPMMDQPVRIDRDALVLGYAGVYSSFLLFAKRAATRYGVSSRDILVEMGRRKTVGGQEDMIEDVALDMARASRGG